MPIAKPRPPRATSWHSTLTACCGGKTTSTGARAVSCKARCRASTSNSDLNANSETTTSTRNQLALNTNRLLRWENYFYGGQGSFLQSSVQGINQQFRSECQ